jgi:hypothetical protein
MNENEHWRATTRRVNFAMYPAAGVLDGAAFPLNNILACNFECEQRSKHACTDGCGGDGRCLTVVLEKFEIQV